MKKHNSAIKVYLKNNFFLPNTLILASWQYMCPFSC